jgi:O-antigen/teichoic acid export membrane protein
VLGLGFFFPAGDMSASEAMMLHVFAGAIAFSIGAVLLARAAPVDLRTGTKTIIQARSWLSSAFSLALIVGAAQLNKQVDVVLLGLLDTAESVGIYRVAAQGALLVIFPLMAINAAIAPHFARLHQAGEIRSLQKVATASSRAVFVLTLPLFLSLAFFGEWIVTLLFGPEFALAALPLTILAGGQMLAATVSSAAILLAMTGHERDTAKVLVGCLVINVCANLALIPSMGFIGAALAATFTVVLQNLTLWRLARHRLNIETMFFGARDNGR